MRFLGNIVLEKCIILEIRVGEATAGDLNLTKYISQKSYKNGPKGGYLVFSKMKI